ncbi:GumC family protein [Pseudohalioglobus lutimaris]|uniref:non-specific protein-tyrosine kinase n=1 Tax=Pseudohalioglobus lutimaris TaxID=1737061 RepID=A0A2N5X1F3_9GAMM|nr:polysaccharide biosynthesis tyrosine autokinase [Pseudohalioglobus lutimaris]PLW68324.1 lipopolysaccharide biosynthesis protein [Pseudohalioglobus lutimaris]
MNANSQFTAAPSAPARDDDEFIDLGQILRAILRYKWGIAGLALTVTVAVGFYVYSLEPIYRAGGSLQLMSAERDVMSVEDYYGTGQYGYDYFQTQFEILKARSLAENVVRKLELHKHPYFLPDPKVEEEPGWFDFDFSLQTLLPAAQKEVPEQLSEAELEEQAIKNVTNAVAGSLSVAPVEFSHLAYVSLEMSDPQLAARVVNALMEAFIASDLEQRLSGTVQATGWLDERLGHLREQLRLSELALQEFRDAEGLVSVDGETTLGGSELQLLSQRLEDARRARIEAQNIMEDVQGMVDASTEQLMTIPAVLQHQLIRDLKKTQSGAERKVAELRKRYGEKHPQMIAARSDLAEADRDLAREVRKVVSGIEREYDLALRNEQQLQATWESSKSDLQEFNRIEFRLQELQREVDTSRQLYDIFLARVKSLSETGGFERPHARIVDRATVPDSPVKPNKRLSLMLALFLSTMFGCAVAYLLELLDNTVKTPEDVAEKLNVPLLGALPKMDTGRGAKPANLWQQPQGVFAEAVRTVRTSVVLGSLDTPAQVIVVTSTLPEEGKSSTVLNLGAAFAQMEKTLVIGADLRRPSLALKCKLAANHKGLSHYVSGAASLEECIEPVAGMGMDVMPAGLIPPNPLEMLGSKRFADALDALRRNYDRIIIDSAPTQPVSDALVLASLADAVIYVVKADSTSTHEVQKGVAALQANNAPLAGVVLNQLDMKGAGKDYYNYAYDYRAGQS